LDLEKKEFHQKVQDGYRQVLGRFPDRIVTINADGDVPSIHAEIRNVLDDRMARLSNTNESNL
jgi:dTMP kinase